MRYVLYAALALFVATRPQLRETFRQLDGRRRAFVGGLFALIVIGHAIHDKELTYPFVRWGMYAKPLLQVEYFEYTGVRSNGSEAPFPISQLVRTHTTSRALECPTCGKRFFDRLEYLTREFDALPAGPERDAVDDLYLRTLRSAWKGYKGRHPEADFHSVRVDRRNTSVSEYRQSRSISRTFVREVELD
jgi:hypothetical protein